MRAPDTAVGRVAGVAGRAARSLRHLALGGAAWMLAAPAARACQACFGAEDSPIMDGSRAGAWILIGLTLSVEGAFVAFFIYLRRRARRAAAIELGSELHGLQRNTRWS